jgi:hypothetical protein
LTNQLLAEAEALPELDEFSGLSIIDIAHAIIAWPPGSEDQARAIAALRARAPGIGHNRPPLAERLDDDLAGLKGRADALLERAQQSKIIDDESAAKVLDLAAMMDALEKELETRRKGLNRPYADAVAMINQRIGAIADPIRIARQGEDRRGGLRAMLTEWDDRKTEEANAARRAAEEHQRKLEEEAAAKRKAIEEQKAAGANTVTAELDALHAEDEAEKAAQRASAIRPEPLRSHVGQISRSREIKWKIGEGRGLAIFIGWMLKQPGGRSALLQFANTWLGRHLRGIGVDTIDSGGIEIPSVKVWVEKGAANVRR